MTNMVYVYALGANFCFALASIVFTRYSRRVSSIWMNCSKAVIASACFGLAVSLSDSWSKVDNLPLMIMLFSGGLGLCIGDIFLLESFKKIGPGRTLLLFGFQPMILGIGGHFLFNQTIDPNNFWAIAFFIGCLGIFSFENFKKSGHWELSGILFALIGMLLDAIGILTTRYAFEISPATTALEVNFYRTVGAMIGFAILSQIRPFGFFDTWQRLAFTSRAAVIFGSFLGTFLSLSLYLKALKTANLASLSGLAITGPMFASIFECVYEKKLPSRYLLFAFLFFLGGLQFLFK